MISIELYRARIGAFNAPKTRDVTIAHDDKKFDFSPQGEQYIETWASISLKLPVKFSVVSIMTLALIKILLVIGNVESNPGPAQTDRELALADLIIASDDDDIKKVLSLTKLTNSTKDNHVALRGAKFEPLQVTLKYLMNWDDDEAKGPFSCYTKEGIIHLILRRLRNLLPELCGSCGDSTHFSPSEYSHDAIACLKCERLMCNSCCSDELKNLPTFTKSIFFVCKSCVDSIKDSEKLVADCFRKGKSLPKPTTTPTTSTPPTPLPQTIPPDATAATETVADNDAATEALVENNSAVTEDADVEVVTITTDASTPEVVKSTNLCRFFIRSNNCKHGISGKSCRFTHPKTCSKFRQFGSGIGGCRKGTSCNYHHQKVCISVRKNVTCDRKDCHYIHPKVRINRDLSSPRTPNRSNFLDHGAHHVWANPPKMFQPLQPLQTPQPPLHPQANLLNPVLINLISRAILQSGQIQRFNQF